MADRTDPQFLKKTTPPHFATLIIMAGVSAMAMNMFLPSLPSMAVYFDVDYSLMQLSVVLFLAVNGALQLIIGPLSDRFGRRPVILWGMAIFFLASIGCIFAPSAEIFLAFRMVQASVVVGMVLSRAIVRDMYDQEDSASMIGYLTMGMAVIPMVTPALGGFLDEHFGWKANFWAFLAIGGATTALVWQDLGETNASQSSSFGQQFRDYPALLTSPRFWGYVLCAAFSSGGFFAYLGGAPYVGTTVFDLSPSQLGIWFGSPALGYALGNGITGRFAGRLGINRLILTGTILTAIPLILCVILMKAGWQTPLVFFGSMILMGIGNGLVMPNATAGILSVRPQLAGTASGLGGAMMIGGGAGLSSLSGHLLDGGTSAFPLLWLMLGVTALGMTSILFVIWRERQLGLAPGA